MDIPIGLHGLICFTVLTFISLWRFIVFIQKFNFDGHWYRCPRSCRPICPFPFISLESFDAESTETRALQPVQVQSLMAQRKLEIHALILASMVIELPVFALGSASEPGLLVLYQWHMTAYALLHAAFALYVTQASKIVFLENRHRMRVLFWVLLLSTLMFVPLLVGISLKCDRVISSDNKSHVSEFKACQRTPWFQALQYYNIIALFLLGSSLIVVTCMLQRRMFAVLGPSSGGIMGTGDILEGDEIESDREFNSKFYYALCRMNVVMVACTVSFLIRAVLFARLIQLSYMKSDEFEGSSADQEWKWLMYQEWIPAAVPTLALLYLMRDVKKAGPIAMMKSNHQNFNFGTPNHRQWGSMDRSSHDHGMDIANSSNKQASMNGSSGFNKIPGKYELVDPDVL